MALYRERSPRLAAARSTDRRGRRGSGRRADLSEPDGRAVESRARSHDVNSTSAWSEALDVEIPLLDRQARKPRDGGAGPTSRRSARTSPPIRPSRSSRSAAQFIALQAAQQRTTTLAAALEDARAVRGIVAGRASAGAKSPYELERIELAVAALASRLDEARADERAASARAREAVGVPGWHPRARPASSRRAAAAVPSALNPAHPALAAGRAARALGTRRRAARPGRGGRRSRAWCCRRSRPRPRSAFGISAGFSVPLPLFDRNQGAVARSRADARRAELELAARTRARRGARSLRPRCSRCGRATLARFQAEAIERLPRLRAMAESAYRSGQGGIVELLDALDAITDARLRAIELLAGVVGAELAVRTAALGR